MNYGAYNSSTLNGSANTAEDAVLSGAADTFCSLVSAVILSAVLYSGVATASELDNNGLSYSLRGGIHQTSNAYGNVAALATGGVVGSNTLGGSVAAGLAGGFDTQADISSSVSVSFSAPPLVTNRAVGGQLYIPTTLPFGINATNELGGDLFWKPGNWGGVESICHVGGGYVISANRHGGVSSSLLVDAGFNISPNLTGGLSTHTVLASVSHISAVLNGGLDSFDSFDTGVLRSGLLIVGGVSTSSELNSTYKCDVRLSSGVTQFHQLYSQLDSDAVLSNGMVTVASTDASITIDTELEGGVTSYGYTDAVLLSEPRLIGMPTHSSSDLSASYVKSAVLHFGIHGQSEIGGIGLVTNLRLYGAYPLYSDASFNSGIVISPHLNDGVHASDNVGGVAKIIPPTLLLGGVDTSSNLSSLVRLEPVLSSTTMFSENALFGSLRTAIILRSGAHVTTQTFNAGLIADHYMLDQVQTGPTSIFSAEIIIVPKLNGGIEQTYRLSDADISSYYGDMLHNTWQLEIASATEILEISTPIGDS